MMPWVKLLAKNRFIILLFFIVAFLLFNLATQKSLLPSTEVKDLWFYSGLFMVLFSILFIEPYYSSPKNVLTNTIPLVLVLIAIKSDIGNEVLWSAGITLLGLLALFSVIAMSLEQPEVSPSNSRNKVAEIIKRIVVSVGQGKVLYSAVFIYFLLSNYSVQNYYTQVLFITWAIILMMNPKSISSSFRVKQKDARFDAIGEVFGVQSRRMFLVKLYEDKGSVKKFDLVNFCYSMNDKKSECLQGFVFDTYLLNREKWAKVLHLKDEGVSTKNLQNNIVYKIYDKSRNAKLRDGLRIDSFVGVVSQGSTIAKVRFEYSKMNDNLQEGDLLELTVGERRLFYQVVSGLTQKEILEAKNETGFIEGEAIQLGEWQKEKMSFQKFGWVPEINTPLFSADTSKMDVPAPGYPEYKLGNIPGTSFPSIINLDHAISHHTALLGITGSGKSFLAREMIRELKKNTKIMIVDFTGEWSKELRDLKIESMDIGGGNIDTFLGDGSKRIGIVGIPDMSNTKEILEQTQKLFERVFNFAKKQYREGKECKIALVLEEAHTITPEANFLGVGGDFGESKAIVSKMTQIALQGRKYGVGMLVIAQRTANVSKTVLTQCNTVICFQAFDDTSFGFLGNYVGKDMVEALPNLRQYQAIVTGKAMRANMPMIVDLRREFKNTSM